MHYSSAILTLFIIATAVQALPAPQNGPVSPKGSLDGVLLHKADPVQPVKARQIEPVEEKAVKAKGRLRETVQPVKVTSPKIARQVEPVEEKAVKAKGKLRETVRPVKARQIGPVEADAVSANAAQLNDPGILLLAVRQTGRPPMEADAVSADELIERARLRQIDPVQPVKA